MDSFEPENACPRCLYPAMKSWDELTDDERFLAERLPANSQFSLAERRLNLFCPRCWHEQPPRQRTA